MSRTTLHLAKQNFKFSAAHFLIFDAHHAEKLHGHNYQVQVELEIKADATMEQRGYSVDFNVFKKYIKTQLDKWDEHILLPAQHEDMKTRSEGTSLHVNFRDRYYVFPQNEVILLAITNTSVEQLSRLLAEDFARAFKTHSVAAVKVLVEETQGQGASTSISLSK